MTELPATVRNSAGIHCRPSAAIVKETMPYAGRITVTGENGTCDLKSIMGLLALGLEPGAEVVIRVEGPQEEKMCRKLVKLFETRFDFPPREDEPAPTGKSRSSA